MKEKEYGKKEFGKLAISTFAIIGTCTMLFSGITEMVMATEIGKTETVFTNYSSTSSASAKKLVPKGYVKANYKVVSDPLEYYNDKKPTAKDLTQEQAAELGAQLLWELFGVDLDKATIYMGYDLGTETFPRAFWSGDVRFGDTRKPGETSYSFMIDAMTGERFQGAFGRTLKETVSLELDMALAKDPSKYIELAEQYAKKLNLVNGEIKSAAYNSQGYLGNDPAITIDIVGTNGLKALMTFSRYDQKLLGVAYDTSIRISDEAFEKILKEAYN